MNAQRSTTTDHDTPGSLLRALDLRLAALQGLGGFLLRLALGAVFLAHGYMAAFTYTPSGTADYMRSIGLPLAGLCAWGLIAVHFAGGAMLLVGLWTRMNAILHGAVMVVATVAAHRDQGFFLRGLILDTASGATAVAGFEYALTLAVASLALAFVGPGSLAMDRNSARSRSTR